MANYLINRPFCYDNFIRSYKIVRSEVRKAGDRPNGSQIIDYMSAKTYNNEMIRIPTILIP